MLRPVSTAGGEAAITMEQNHALQRPSGAGSQAGHLRCGLEIIPREVNFKARKFVPPHVMKKIFTFLASLAVIPLVTSCTDYGVYGYSSTVARPLATQTSFVGGGLAPLQVGFVATSFDRWAWDPYRRHYFDRSCGRFFDPRARRYCTVVPRRYPVAVYPSGYRHGRRLDCPSYLPRTRVVGHHRGRFDHDQDRGRRGGFGVGSNRGRFAPVVHGSSRGSARLDGNSRRGGVNRSGSQRVIKTPPPTRRSVSPPSRRSVNPSSVSRSSRLQTVSTKSSRDRSNSRQAGSVNKSSSSTRFSTPVVRSRSTPTVRSQPTVRRQPTVRSSPPPRVRSSPTIRSSGGSARSSSRGTSSSSRSISRARQRTR